MSLLNFLFFFSNALDQSYAILVANTEIESEKGGTNLKKYFINETKEMLNVLFRKKEDSINQSVKENSELKQLEAGLENQEWLKLKITW